MLVKTHNYVDIKYYRDVDLFVTTTRDQYDWLIAAGIGPAQPGDVIEAGIGDLPVLKVRVVA